MSAVLGGKSTNVTKSAQAGIDVQESAAGQTLKVCASRKSYEPLQRQLL